MYKRDPSGSHRDIRRYDLETFQEDFFADRFNNSLTLI